MATVTLGTLRDLWKAVSDWVDGTDAVSSPKVTVSAELPAGTNNIGDVDLASAIPAGSAIIGKFGIDQTTPGTTNGVQVAAALPAGTNNIGDVDVLTMPAKNIEGTALASAARTATVSSSDITNSYGQSIHVVLDVTASASTPSITLKIEGKDSLSGKYYTILESAAVTGASTNVYRVGPGLGSVSNLAVDDVIPKTFRITMTHSDADSITYSVGYSLV